MGVQHKPISDLHPTDSGFVGFNTQTKCYFRPTTYANHNGYSLFPGNNMEYGIGSTERLAASAGINEID